MLYSKVINEISERIKLSASGRGFTVKIISYIPLQAMGNLGIRSQTLVQNHFHVIIVRLQFLNLWPY